MTTTPTTAIAKSFAEFLQAPAQSSSFEIDLRDATLRQVMEKMFEVKEVSHPGYTKRHAPLLGHISSIEMMCHTVIKPEQVTDLFWGFFQDYLEKDKGLKDSTINALCEQLCYVLRWGSQHNATVSKTYDMFEKKKTDVVKVVLSPTDIARIYYFNVQNIKGRRKDHLKTLERVKDTLVLSCCLGQRYSDLIRISPECFEDAIFRIKQKKTENKAVVDVRRFSFDEKIAREILLKYNYQAPYDHHISNYNKLVKELLKYIGFDSDINVVKKKGGEMVTETVKMWKKVSSHIGRRSFATINTIRNIPRYEIMRATGHSTESSFNKYIVFED